MLYRVRIDLCFDAETIPDGVYAKAKTVLSKAVKLATPVDGIPEPSYIEVHRCFHDEIPRKPCEVIKRIEI